MLLENKTIKLALLLEQHKLWVETKGESGRRANLEYAYLEGANLEYANLRYANLREVNLEGAYLEGADLRGAKLDGARMLEGYKLIKELTLKMQVLSLDLN